MGNKHTNQPLTSLFTTAPHKRTNSLNIKQNKTVFLSHKTHWTWHFIGTRILNFLRHNKYYVLVLHEGQTLCFAKDVLSGRTKQTWNKERDVVSIHCWDDSQPMRNRFLLTQLLVWTMLAGVVLQRTQWALSTQKFGLKLLGLIFNSTGKAPFCSLKCPL